MVSRMLIKTGLGGSNAYPGGREGRYLIVQSRLLKCHHDEMKIPDSTETMTNDSKQD